MKKQFFFSMLAAAMLVGCSNDDVAVNNNGGVAAGEDGYVSFNIQLPQVSGTRANDLFDDGTPVPDEYAVFNGYIVFFKGASTAPESDYTFAGAYPLNINKFDEVGTTTDQCTSEGIASAKITSPDLGTNDLFAYVILNANGLISSPSATGVTVTTHDGSDPSVSTSVTSSTTFQQFSELILPTIGNINDGLVMTNCPVNGAAGGAVLTAPTAGVKTLAALNKTKIFPTRTAAESDPAGEVYVERAAAKVTVNTSLSGSTALTTAAVNYDADQLEWNIMNENYAFYNTRQMINDWVGIKAISATEDAAKNDGTIINDYRFVSAAPIHTGIYRTYWGKDVNYNATVTNLSTFHFSPVPASINKAMNTSVYTYENTFDVDRQSSQNTTQVCISAVFNGGKDFYIASSYGDNNILQVPTYTAGPEKKVQDYIMEYLNSVSSKFKGWYTADSKNRITVSMVDRIGSENGYKKVGTVTLETGANATTFAAAGLTPDGVKDIINAAMNFKFYKGGKAYYRVRIKHFGAELVAGTETPWNVNNHKTSTIDDIYKKIGTQTLTDAEATRNYLGRYGILRNNWYQIEVTGIKQIGYPLPGDPNTPPTSPDDPDDPNPWTPDTPDDEVDNYISVKIHITPWALRKQSVIL